MTAPTRPDPRDACAVPDLSPAERALHAEALALARRDAGFRAFLLERTGRGWAAGAEGARRAEVAALVRWRREHA